MRYKIVSKDWENLISDADFTAEHLHHSAKTNTSLLLQRIPGSGEPSGTLVSSLRLIGPNIQLHHPQFVDFTPRTDITIVGSCNGLLCVQQLNNDVVYLWKPAIRKTFQAPPSLINIKGDYLVGFGFNPTIEEYKIVKICVLRFNLGIGMSLLPNMSFHLTLGYKFLLCLKLLLHHRHQLMVSPIKEHVRYIATNLLCFAN